MRDWWPKFKKQIVKQIIHIFFYSYKFENMYNLFSMNYKYKFETVYFSRLKSYRDLPIHSPLSQI